MVALWQACGLIASYNDPHADFRFTRAGAASDVLVAEDGFGRLIGSVMVGHDGHQAGYTTSAHIQPRDRVGSAVSWCVRPKRGCEAAGSVKRSCWCGRTTQALSSSMNGSASSNRARSSCSAGSIALGASPSNRLRAELYDLSLIQRLSRDRAVASRPRRCSRRCSRAAAHLRASRPRLARG